jgi:iron complex outermembrane receptor protein
MHNRIARLSLLSATISALLAPQAQAQDAGLEEIVVTARQRAELLTDVPATITAFTADDIRSAGIERPEDFIALTPGLSVVNTAEVGDVQVNIRGINTARDAETNFALIVDGVLLTNPNAFNQELANVTQIEVLKGPQGALYGRNAAAGAIILTTKKPTQELAGDVSLGYGKDNEQRVTGWIGGGRGAFAASLGGYYHSTDGEFYNDFLDEDDSTNDFEEYGATGRLIWDNDAGASLDFKAKYSEVSAGAISFNASFALPVFEQFTGVPQFFENVNDHDFRYINNVDPENEQENLNLSVKGDFDVGVGTLTTVFSYNDQQNFFLTDGTSGAFFVYAGEPTCAMTSDAVRASGFVMPPPSSLGSGPGQSADSLLPPYSPTTCDGYQYQQRDQEDFSAEIRLTSPGDQPLRWIAGLYYADIDRRVVVAQGADLNRGFLHQAYVPPSGPNPTDLLYDDDFTSTVYAAFGQIAYDITENIELALAARYDREEREVDNNVPRVTAPFLQPFLCAPNCFINPSYNADPTLTEIPSRDADYSEFQPKVSVNWQINDGWSAYASYGVGFRSGGFNSQGSAETVRQYYQDLFGAQLFNVRDDYDKEVSQAGEIGFKANFYDRRVAVNGAVYQTTVDDMQFFNFFAGPFGLLRVVTNIDEVEITGLELDFKARFNEIFTLYGGFGLLDGEIKENRNRPYTVGNDVPYAPEYTAHLGGELTIPLSGALELVTRVDVTALGETWFHEVQDDSVPTIFTALLGFPVEGDYTKTKRDEFATVNARVTLQGERWGVTVWGRNIGSEEYLQEVIPAPEFGGSFIHDSVEETYGVELRYSF